MDALTYWTDKQRDIHRRLASEDISDFLEWSSIITTMFVGEAPYIAGERAALRAADWGLLLDSLREWGNQPATNLLHQAYHLLQWETITGGRVKDLDSIIEIGAGYGAMARVVRARGFAGRYIIFDLPEMARIQRFYLEQYGISAEWKRAGDEAKADLLISLWGVSEIEPYERTRLLSKIRAERVLLAYQDKWHEVENESCFPEMFEGEVVRIPHIPGTQYLIG